MAVCFPYVISNDSRKRNSLMERISQADIAKHIGVSASTVSLALRNDPRITKKVRQKVIDASQELGYRPDPAVSALANYRWKSAPQTYTGTVAWITVGDEPGELRKTNPEYALYWKGAHTCAERCGYRIEEFSISDNMSMNKLESVLYARNITGLLLPPEPVIFNDWNKLNASNYSIVRMSRSVHNLEAHLVMTNQMADGLLAAKKMNDLGYKRIGFVGHKNEERLFCPGFFWGQQSRNAEFIPPLFLYEIAPDQHAGALAQWIATHKPEAILQDYGRLYDLLDEIGLRCPEDIASASQHTRPSSGTAGIVQNLEEVGRVAMLMLISLINDHDRGIPEIARQLLVKGRWVDGPSLPDRNQTTPTPLT
jgi:DNA-binding LacI/PurR family transcriptional regulator